jgi:hypothetical protein
MQQFVEDFPSSTSLATATKDETALVYSQDIP